MKNKEFYRDKIFEIACEGHSIAVVNGEPAECENTQCGRCDFFREIDCEKLLKEWLEKERKEPKIQPGVKKLKQDDRVLVSANGVDWIKRYFKKYDQERDVVYAYVDGATSWSSSYDGSWQYAKLPEDIKKEIDWANIPVDTKIFVKHNNDSKWFRRHFAKYENGKVYAWGNECTSDQTDDCVWWSYAKLAEGDWIGEIVKK